MTKEQFDALLALINAVIDDKMIDDMHTYGFRLEAERIAEELLVSRDDLEGK